MMLNYCVVANRKSFCVAARGAACLVALMMVAVGCGDNADGDGEPAILPHQSPASFGEMYPLGKHQPDPSGNLRTPFEWVLLLQSSGGQPLEIDRVCLVGEAGQLADSGPFELDVENQALPATVGVGTDFGVRITYDRQSPNDGDHIDQVALVVQSNATNFPTLIVPICARVVADGAERKPVACQSPVTVEPGKRDSDLCN